MSDQTIQSHDIKVADVFQSFYVVPDYQREYVWETEQVEQLLTDVNAELVGKDATKSPEYFIGSIVVCPSTDSVLELIDGQQRMTTLFVILCAIRDRIKELGEAPPGALAPQIAAISTDASGRDQFRFRIDLQYEDSGDVLIQIAKGNSTTNATTSRSVYNIRNAYDVAIGFLKKEFATDVSAIRAFYGYLTNKVKLIRIQTEDVAKALKIFETINDRGVGLDSMDLLKNLLFQKASREQFEELKDIWKELQDTLFQAGEKPLRFLRYFIFSSYDVEILREDEIYSWFRKNENLCGYSSEPVKFAKQLLEAARAYRNFLEAKDRNGAKNRYLENMRLLGGSAARQHLILLLAGRSLASPLFDRLCQEVENLFLCYVVTREPTRDFERNFASWAKEVRAIESEKALNSFLQTRFRKAKSDLAARFADAFKRMTVESLQTYRLRYVLAKFVQKIELAAYGETEGTRWLSRFVGGGFEIEHIFPQNPSDTAKAEFGSQIDPRVSSRLGNLLLVEKSINTSLGNRAYSEKRKVYPQSQLLLTRALAAKPKVGANTKIDGAVSKLDPFVDWNETAIDARQTQLVGLASDIWDVH